MRGFLHILQMVPSGRGDGQIFRVMFAPIRPGGDSGGPMKGRDLVDDDELRTFLKAAGVLPEKREFAFRELEDVGSVTVPYVDVPGAVLTQYGLI